jgi:hypothetical protein
MQICDKNRVDRKQKSTLPILGLVLFQFISCMLFINIF